MTVLSVDSISSLDPQLSKADAKKLVSAADPSRVGFVDIASLHNQLVSTADTCTCTVHV